MVLSKILVNRPGADLRWIGVATWVAAWGLMLLLDGRIALGNLALILVMAGALAAGAHADHDSEVAAPVEILDIVGQNRKRREGERQREYESGSSHLVPSQ